MQHDYHQLADKVLLQAQGLGQIGRFQLEAAIQSVHCNRESAETTDWPAIAHLYEGLLKISPTMGNAIGRASAVGQAFGPEAGLQCLQQIDEKAQANFQPAWATRASLLLQLGDTDAAEAAFNRAAVLTTQPAIKRYLIAQKAYCQTSHSH